MIHKTVVIDDTAGDVHIADTAIIEPYAVITGPCIIEADVYVGAHAVIGAPAQHHGTWPAPISAPPHAVGVVLEQDACVREFCTVHQGLRVPTTVRDRALLMAGCHIAHDCEVGVDATLGSFTILGGFTIIGPRVTFGQGCVTHPWVVIGEGAMVGLNSSVLRDVAPYEKVAGAPIRTLGTNKKQLGDSVLSDAVWNEHATRTGTRDERKADWYA